MNHLYLLQAICKYSSRFGMTVNRILLMFTGLIFSLSGLGQQPGATYTRSYLNNIVEIGLSDYGLITGEDSTHLFFIAIRQPSFERIAPAIKTVKFYGNTYKTRAEKVSEVRFGSYTVVLYQSVKAETNTWQREYFYSLAHKKGRLATFRDKWLSDKIWAVHDTKIEILKVPKKGSSIYTLKVPLDAGVAKGMPLVNNEGFIAGVFTESTLGKKIVKAIDMKDIADALYILAGNNCQYVTMLEWGKADTRCVLEQLAKEAEEAKAKLEAEAKAKKEADKLIKEQPAADKDTSTTTVKKREPRRRFLDIGVHGNMLAAPVLANNPGKDNYFGTRSLHAGLSLHFNIDKKGLNRLTLKPRYGSFYERNDGNIWASPGEEVRMLISSYQYAEIPVVLERQLFSSGNYSIAIGAGYAPGWVFSHQYKWVDKVATGYNVEKVSGSPSSSLQHRLVGELYLYESRSIRFGAIYMQDLSGYPHPEYKLAVNGVDYHPFADRKKAWYVGLELGIRLGGSWGKYSR